MITAFIEPGSPWATGCVARFCSKPLEELLEGDIVSALEAARILIGA